jgi:hypothetical protein
MDFDPDHNNLNHRNAKKHTEEDDGGIDSPVDESLYALFNLPKSATVEEIRDRYKSLAGERSLLLLRLIILEQTSQPSLSSSRQGSL